ncbi:GerMN domain-containing protein [Mechercharimyces sp. CAU 1602]|uniref:GerMN domain-containing protein n=1 Tax=Mechercharimyces sp. CAU 1602 TaxID=2973933 RepID=UPI00216213B7|nr:GerMN domain-containing protein [Mechercharimyces sp. CAU 1602]MCS1351480.1 GerMN domain-containing protein [Mechercharimyces sp. CAU 1602]
MGAYLRSLRMITLLIALAMVFVGCSLGADTGENKSIDPPPEKMESEQKEESEAKSDEEKEEKKTTSGIELYYLDEYGYLVPYAMGIPKVEGIAKEALMYMVESGPAADSIPAGFRAILPKGTQVKGLNIDGRVATVDLSKEFLTYDAEMEEKILNAITWTLTGFESVEEVNIWVEGKPLAAMPEKKSPAQKLSRSSGINVEVSRGIDVTKSMPVTLYFLGQTSEDQVYYVPVTRMIDRKEKVAEAALAELIQGPTHGDALVSALSDTTKVNSVDVSKDLISADFSKELLDYAESKSASKEAIQAIVLSLTENAEAKKVKITVDGEAQVKADGELLGKPVSRPKQVNPNSL